jgi:hypothetical protein
MELINNVSSSEHKYQLTLNSLWKYVNEIIEVAYLPPHGNNVRSTYAKEYKRTLRLAADRRGQDRHGEAVVKIEAAGVCGRDLVVRKGAFPHVNQPVVPDREGSWESGGGGAPSLGELF